MNVYGELCMFGVQTIHQLYKCSIVNSQGLEPTLFICTSLKALLGMVGSPEMFIVSVPPLTATLTHLLGCFSYNFSKQGHMTLILLTFCFYSKHPSLQIFLILAVHF